MTEPLRFGLLTYGLDRPLAGIGRSVLELGWALARRPDCAPLFLTPYGSGPFTDDGLAHARLRGARLLPALMSVGALQVPAVAHRYSLPLVHDPTGVSPFLLGRWAGRYKRIVTLHDAIAFRYPEGYTRLNNFLHRHYVPATLKHVDAVITVSEAARDDLVRFLGCPDDRVHVVPWATSAAFRVLPAEAAARVVRRYGLQPPFVLHVGALQARKNLPTLLRAFAHLRQEAPDVTLAIAGRPTWHFAEIPQTVEALGLGGAVHFLGYVADADLPALYNAASVFSFPSLYEGFGLPVLEAMACGTPVVCSDASALPESAGGAALLVDPYDHRALADALGQVLSDQALADELRRRGLARAARFSWDRTAELTLAIYRRVLEE